MESADVYVLSKLRWQFFGSLTFRTERLPQRVRMSMFFALMRKAAKDFRVYFPGLPWCLRVERGEINRRLHNHFLLTGLPENAVCVATCFAMMRIWTNKLRGGYAQIRIFDPRLSGVDYVAKCLGYQVDGADVYESAKFGMDGRELIYSCAVWDEANHFRRRADR
jgi:hypothetical protein